MKYRYFIFLYIIILLLSITITGMAAENQTFIPYQYVWELETDFKSIDLSSSGNFILMSTNSEIKILDIRTRKIITRISINSDQTPIVSASGDNIVANVNNFGENTIQVLDRNLIRVWSYQDKNINYIPMMNDISSTGKNVISAYFEWRNNQNNVILYFFENEVLIWKKELDNTSTINDVSISSDGSLIGICVGSSLKGNFLLILDKNGSIKKEIEGFYKFKFSIDEKYAVGIKNYRTVTYFNINTNDNIWELNDNKDFAVSLDQTPDLNPIVIGFRNSVYFLNKNGNVTQKYDSDGPIVSIGISSDGKYVMIAMENRIAILSNDNSSVVYKIPHLIYPREGQVLEDRSVTLKWEYQGNATKYLIKISNKTYTSYKNDFSLPSDFLNYTTYKWEVKAIKDDGSETDWSSPRTFSIIAVFDPIVAYIGGILVIGVAAILFRPFYKRFKVKRDMAKTPSDWCPHCLKFTGGATDCPHCGKTTLKQMHSEKIKKKQKEKL